MSKKSTSPVPVFTIHGGYSIADVDDSAGVVEVVATTSGSTNPPPSQTQVNSSHFNVRLVPSARSTGAHFISGSQVNSVPPVSDARRNPLREVRRKQGFRCQLCSERDNDRMVQCDGDGCKKWFHYECVGNSGDVADVTWICPLCTSAREAPPTANNPPTSANRTILTANEQRQGQTDPANNDVGSGRPNSKASSVRSDARRMMELELQKLKDEMELEKKFLERKYAVLKEYGSDTSSVVSDEEIAKIQEWVEETDRHGEEDDSGLVEETNGHASNIPKQPEEHLTPSPAQRNCRTSIHPDQAGQPLHRGPTHHPIPDRQPSNIPSMNPGTLVDDNRFIPGHRSTPVHQPPPNTPPAGTVNNETVCILNRSQLAARQAVSKDLPEFSGNPEDWPLFFSMFNSSTQMCGFSNEENMLRIRKCLKGKALEAVRCRLLHPSNVAGVMSTLKMLYGRPEAIVQAIIRKVRLLPSPNMEKLETIVNFALTVENLVATIQACEVNVFVYNSSLRYELIERLPSCLKMDWVRFSRGKPNPTLIDFSAWLYTMAEDASAVMISSSSSEPRTREGKKDGFLNFYSEAEATSESFIEAPTNSQPTSTVVNVDCIVCRGSCASVANCKTFEELSYDGKWATVNECNLCKKCLRKHNGPCKRSQPCETNGCKFLHHPLLHCIMRHEDSSPSSSMRAEASTQTELRRVDRSCNVHQGQSDILFRIVPVMLYGPTKTIRTYAFVDDGSELTLMDQSLADELGVQGPTKSLCLKWTGGTQKMSQSQRVNVQISGVHNSKKYELSGVYTIPSLQIRPQTLLLTELQRRYPHLAGLPLESYNNVSPRILIGLDHARLGLAIKSRVRNDNAPIAVKTHLGWMVFGSCNGTERVERYVNYHSVESCESTQARTQDLDDNSHRVVNSFFPVDGLEVCKLDKLLVSQHNQRAQTPLEMCTRRTEFSRCKRVPRWKSDHVRLLDSETMALRRWRCLRHRMRKDPRLAEAIKAKMDHVSKGYVQKLTAAELQTLRDNHRATLLTISPVYKRFSHQNRETVANEMKQRYRIPWLKAAYSQIRSDCQRCKILLATLPSPAKGDLPPARLPTFIRPFSHVGIAFFSSCHFRVVSIIVFIGRRTEKRWGDIVTCSATHTIHMQIIAHTLTIDSCVMAIRNIMARRGVSVTIHSDCGINFRAASKELQTALKNSANEALLKEFTSSRTEWPFNRTTQIASGGIYMRPAVSLAVPDVDVETNTQHKESSRIPGGSVDRAPFETIPVAPNRKVTPDCIHHRSSQLT